jgi:hypothetical protein
MVQKWRGGGRGGGVGCEDGGGGGVCESTAQVPCCCSTPAPLPRPLPLAQPLRASWPPPQPSRPLTALHKQAGATPRRPAPDAAATPSAVHTTRRGAQRAAPVATTVPHPAGRRPAPRFTIMLRVRRRRARGARLPCRAHRRTPHNLLCVTRPHALSAAGRPPPAADLLAGRRHTAPRTGPCR